MFCVTLCYYIINSLVISRMFVNVRDSVYEYKSTYIQYRYDDPSEVYVARDHRVEVSKQLQFAQVNGRLAVCTRRVLQVSY